jgi:hypothetical protein
VRGYNTGEKIGSLACLGRIILNMLMLVQKYFFDYAYVSPENFFWVRTCAEESNSRTFQGHSRSCWFVHVRKSPLNVLEKSLNLTLPHMYEPTHVSANSRIKY